MADSWQGLGRTRNTLAQYIPMWVVIVAVAALLFFSFSGFRWWLYKTSTPVANELKSINDQVIEEKLEAKEKAENKQQ